LPSRQCRLPSGRHRRDDDHRHRSWLVPAISSADFRRQFIIVRQSLPHPRQWRAGGLFLGMGGFFGKQGFAVFLRDLVIVRMDFAEGQKP
jgi:hypothetical protein